MGYTLVVRIWRKIQRGLELKVKVRNGPLHGQAVHAYLGTHRIKLFLFGHTCPRKEC